MASELDQLELQLLRSRTNNFAKQAAGSAVKATVARKLHKANAPKKKPLFQPSLTVVRTTADSTLNRPPRLFYGYSAVSGTHRDYARLSANRACDRLFYCDNWCGSNEQSLFGVLEGHGFAGARIAAWLAASFPDIISTIAYDTAKRKKKRGDANADFHGVDNSIDQRPTGGPSVPGPSADSGSLGRYHHHPRATTVPRAETDLDKVASAAKAILALTRQADADADGSAPPHDGGGGRRPLPSAASATASSSAGDGALSRVQTRIGEIARDSFRAAQRQLSSAAEADPGVDPAASGASLCLCIVRGRTLVVANAGSCRAVLGRTVDALTLRSAVNGVAADYYRQVVVTSIARKLEDIVNETGVDELVAATLRPSGTGNGRRGSAAGLAAPGRAHPLEAASISTSGSSVTGASIVDLTSSAKPRPENSGGVPQLNKYSRMSAANRMARLTQEIGAVDMRARLEMTAASSGAAGGSQPAAAAAAARSSLTGSSNIGTGLTPGSNKAALTSTAISASGIGASICLAQAYPHLLPTTSIPAFPDVPIAIERVLHSSDASYTKPSAMLQKQRRDLVRAIKANQATGQGAGQMRSAEAVDARFDSLGADDAGGGVSGGQLHVTIVPGTARSSAFAAGSPSAAAFARRNTSLSVTSQYHGNQASIDSPTGSIDGDGDSGRGRTGGVFSPGGTQLSRTRSDAAMAALRTRDPKLKAMLLEQAEMQDLAVSLQKARFDYHGKLIKGGHGRATDTMAVPSSSPAVGDRHHQMARQPRSLQRRASRPDIFVAMHTHHESRSSDKASPTAASAASGGGRASSRDSELAATAAAVASAAAVADSGDGEVDDEPVDFSLPPPGWETTELGKSVLQRYGKAHGIAARTAMLTQMQAGTHGVGGDLGGGQLPAGDTDAAATAEALADARNYDDRGHPVSVPTAVTLSIDHRPDRPCERDRVIKCGGKVEVGVYQDGTRGGLARVFGINTDGPGLAVSRCIGYTAGQGLGITCEPEVTIRSLDASDRFVIVASDGLWMMLSSDEAVRIVHRVTQGMCWGGTGEVYRPDEDDEIVAIGATSRDRLTSATTGAAANSTGAAAYPTVEPPAALTASAVPPSGHPASAAVAFNPSLASRPAQPFIEHPSPQLHTAPAASELRVSVCAGPAPAAGCGGGGGSDAMPLDLDASVQVKEARQRRVDRMRRVALAASEALVSAAKQRWQAQTASKVRALEIERGITHQAPTYTPRGAASGRPTTPAGQHRPHSSPTFTAAGGGTGAGTGPGAYDDIAVMVVLLDHIRK